MSDSALDLGTIVFLVVGVIVLAAWYLSYSASRLDRLHAKVEGAMSALDAQLVRRAEASLELAASGALDPATSLVLADAASAAVDRHTEHPLREDPLDGQNFAGREPVESDLTRALEAALPPETCDLLRATDEDGELDDAAAILARVEGAALRVQLARQFHNDAVAEVRRVRAKTVVRLFRLAGHAALPEVVHFDDDLPPGLRS